MSEMEILAEVIGPDEADMSPEAAQAVLQWKFTPRARQRMNTLARRNSKGTITLAEREDLERYLRVGSFINLVQAKARLSLQQSNSGR